MDIASGARFRVGRDMQSNRDTALHMCAIKNTLIFFKVLRGNIPAVIFPTVVGGLGIGGDYRHILAAPETTKIGTNRQNMK